MKLNIFNKWVTFYFELFRKPKKLVSERLTSKKKSKLSDYDVMHSEVIYGINLASCIRKTLRNKIISDSEKLRIIRDKLLETDKLLGIDKDPMYKLFKNDEI